MEKQTFCFAPDIDFFPFFMSSIHFKENVHNQITEYSWHKAEYISSQNKCEQSNILAYMTVFFCGRAKTK